MTLRSWRSLRRIGFWYTGSTLQSFDFPEETNDCAIKNGLRVSFRNNFYKQGFELLTFLCILHVFSSLVPVGHWRYCQWSPLMRSPFPAVGKIFNFVLGGLYLNGFIDNVGRATWEACSVTWNLATNSEFALGPGKLRKTFAGWPVAGPSEYLLLTSV